MTMRDQAIGSNLLAGLLPEPSRGRASRCAKMLVGGFLVSSTKKTISVGSDMPSPVVDFAMKYLTERGYVVDSLVPAADATLPWPAVGEHVGQAVSSGQCQEGIVFCWTGTGVSIAANKVPGIRAALCHDAQTATGARRWNDANVLAMSLRVTTEALAAEILDAWFAASLDAGDDMQRVAELGDIDRKYRSSDNP